MIDLRGGGVTAFGRPEQVYPDPKGLATTWPAAVYNLLPSLDGPP